MITLGGNLFYILLDPYETLSKYGSGREGVAAGDIKLDFIKNHTMLIILASRT
jgi:hypothetical protein